MAKLLKEKPIIPAPEVHLLPVNTVAEEIILAEAKMKNVLGSNSYKYRIRQIKEDLQEILPNLQQFIEVDARLRDVIHKKLIDRMLILLNID